MTERHLPPSCPVCAGRTRLKATSKFGKESGIMCFFFCQACALEYPVALKSADADRDDGTPRPA